MKLPPFESLKKTILDSSVPPYERLVALMAALRSEHGCAWDRKQTHTSLLPYLIEESYEVVEAVEQGSDSQLCEELGDLACQIAFHAQLAAERKAFDLDDALRGIVEKLIRRHPHVFGDRQALSPREVRDQWEKSKVESGEKPGVLAGLPASMPALAMAFRVGEKAGGVGFDWPDVAGVYDKIAEELAEIQAAVSSGDKDRIEDEIGDLLFAVSSLARKLEVNPEQALKRALEKFRTRFAQLEAGLKSQGKTFSDMSLEQLEEIWQSIK